VRQSPFGTRTSPPLDAAHFSTARRTAEAFAEGSTPNSPSFAPKAQIETSSAKDAMAHRKAMKAEANLIRKSRLPVISFLLFVLAFTPDSSSAS
jgi:hypothetical protein